MIGSVDGAATDEACLALIDAHRAMAKREVKDVIYREALPREANAILGQVAQHCEMLARQAFHEFEPVIETVLLSRLGPGGRHLRHADNCKEEGGAWVPNHTPARVVSSILYLNSDFDGGEIVFEQHGPTIIKPRRGLLLLFPSDRHHVHEVRPVTAGYRYTAAIWFKRGFNEPALSDSERR
jgi:predicted 2-oxoglutarate/Fe(II)-dependent dioxygenase YbiX